MWRTTKEEWERRKSYLIRSLFEDLPILSPINESQEPTQSSSDVYRPESPLPDLIIEKELSREKKYHQDEPEEFYEKLAREMRKLYKRDFLHFEQDTTTSSNTSCEIDNENYTQIDSSFDVERCVEAEKFDNGDSLQDEEYYSEISKEEEIQKSTSTSSNKDSTESDECKYYEQITIKVQVHTNVEEKSEQLLPDMIHRSDSGSIQSELTKIIDISEHHISRASSKEKEHSIKKYSEIGQKEGIGQTEPDRLVKPIEASPESTCLKSPETMRRHQTIFSNDFLPYHELPIRQSNENLNNESLRMEIENSFSLERLVASGVEMEVADASLSDSNIVLNVTSTPKSSKVRRSKIIDRHKNRIVPYSPSSTESLSLKWKSKCQVALQTSFTDDEPDLRDIWNNFFVGTPTIYNVCSCRNHVCS
ncbi:unnamed protein product [Euphydryas editha]|uniref:Uncharacterized protein n=1 Tax=Euphydryas editha TaxID=104508 RepID=A0AAU9USK2_EUPED|nr:unnamed protein product [Euphydryas editha]